MEKNIININLDVKCKRCGEKGATPNGLCIKCIAKGVKKGDYNHIIKKH